MSILRVALACAIVILCVSNTNSVPRFAPRIYGGQLAKAEQFSFIASVQVLNKYGILVHVCGGSIITAKHILTAAHCTESKGRLNVGLYKIFVGNYEISEGQVHEVQRFIAHPLHNPMNLRNDIMFIELSNEIKFASNIQPVGLHRDEIKAGQRVITAGWGRSNDGISSLKSVELTTITNDACLADLLSLATRPPVYENVVCAYSGDFGHGICEGDSGGPLIMNGSLVGVTTWGFGCAEGHPDGFQRISSFLEWIDEVLLEQ